MELCKESTSEVSHFSNLLEQGTDPDIHDNVGTHASCVYYVCMHAEWMMIFSYSMESTPSGMQVKMEEPMLWRCFLKAELM